MCRVEDWIVCVELRTGFMSARQHFCRVVRAIRILTLCVYLLCFCECSGKAYQTKAQAARRVWPQAGTSFYAYSI